MPADPALTELVDRQQIYDCLVRYCRGIDRCDRELALSAFHDDAHEDHGAYKGPSSGMFDWAMAFVDGVVRQRAVHTISNHYVEIEGDVAHAETYFIGYYFGGQGDAVSMSAGRYVDRFEKRASRWAIAARVVVREGSGQLPAAVLPDGMSDANYRPSRRDRLDVSYERPPDRASGGRK